MSLACVCAGWKVIRGSPWEELTQTTDHHPLPSVEDQLCRGRVMVL